MSFVFNATERVMMRMIWLTIKRPLALILGAITFFWYFEAWILKQEALASFTCATNEARLRDQDGLDPLGLIVAKKLPKWRSNEYLHPNIQRAPSRISRLQKRRRDLDMRRLRRD